MKTTIQNDEERKRTIITLDQSQPINAYVLALIGTSYEEVVKEYENNSPMTEGYIYFLDDLTMKYAAEYIADFLHETAKKRFKKAAGRNKWLDENYEFPVIIELVGEGYGRGVEAEIYQHLQDKQRKFGAARAHVAAVKQKKEALKQEAEAVEG